MEGETEAMVGSGQSLGNSQQPVFEKQSARAE